MILGLIAAGEGSRLRREGIQLPKGLVPVAGEPLAKRTIQAFVDCGVQAVKCIVNEESPELSTYLRNQDFGVPVEVIVKSTPSSMHSLFTLAPLLADSPFFLATVDAVYRRDDLADYVQYCANHPDADGVLAVTRLVDDEKPLYVQMNSEHRVCAMGDNAHGSEWITAGLYYFKPEIFQEIPRAEEKGMERLRNFQGHLVEQGYRIYGHPFGDVVDVDHRKDISKAEALLEQWEQAT